MEEIKLWDPDLENKMNSNNNLISNYSSQIQLYGNDNYKTKSQNYIIEDNKNNNQGEKEFLTAKIKVLEHKLENKKIKIKNLKQNLNDILEENEKLKSYSNTLEIKLNELTIENKKIMLNKNNSIEKNDEYISKIKLLENELNQKEEKISQLEKIDEIKSNDLEMLTQKNKDLELICDENLKDFNNKVNKINQINENLNNKLLEIEGMFESMNYFVKRISSIFPELYNHNINMNNLKEFQNELLIIENCINDLSSQKNFVNIQLNKALNSLSNLQKQKENDKKDIFEIGDKHYKKAIDMEKKIKEISEENQILEKQISLKNSNKKKRSVSKGKNKIKSKSKSKY